MQKYFVAYQKDNQTLNAIIEEHPCEFINKNLAQGEKVIVTFWSKLPDDLKEN